MRRIPVRHDAFDNVHLGLAISFISSVIAGIDWPGVAAMLAAIYSLLLIAEKLYRWVKKDKPDGDE
jgi:hypothetical protein